MQAASCFALEKKTQSGGQTEHPELLPHQFQRRHHWPLDANQEDMSTSRWLSWVISHVSNLEKVGPPQLLITFWYFLPPGKSICCYFMLLSYLSKWCTVLDIDKEVTMVVGAQNVTLLPYAARWCEESVPSSISHKPAAPNLVQASACPEHWCKH